MARYDFIDTNAGVRYIGSTPERNVGDYLHHNYKPVDPSEAHAWGLLAAQNAAVPCLLIGVACAAVSFFLATQLWVTRTDSIIDILGKWIVAGLIGLVLPFFWPFRRPFRSPWRAYDDQVKRCEETHEKYNAVALERLRTPATPTLEKIVGVERQERDKLEELYRQCAIVLVMLRYGAEPPREAKDAIIRDVEGMTVKVDKVNFGRIAGTLCELGLAYGGNGEKYRLTDEWKDAEPRTLLEALKARKGRITLKAKGKADDGSSWG